MDMSSDSQKTFADRLKLARRLRAITQQELANRAHLQPSAVSHFESNRRTPSFENLRRLADALDVSTDYLLGRTEKTDEVGIVAYGPTADVIFAHAKKLKQSELEMLEAFAKMLSERTKN